jgi:hypothetical protein
MPLRNFVKLGVHITPHETISAVYFINVSSPNNTKTAACHIVEAVTLILLECQNQPS